MTTTAIEYKHVQLSHGKTRYIEAGSGRPVILLHGSRFQSGAEDWLPNIDALAAGHRVLAPDMLGWGLSDTLDEEYSFAYLVDFIREFQDALGIEHSDVIGASMGGWLAGLLAYESPERCDKVVQTGHNGIDPRPNPRMSNFSVPSDDEMRSWVENVTKGSRVDTQRIVAERIEKAHQPGVGEAFAKIMRHMADGKTRARYDLARRLPHVKARTLYVWGAKDGTIGVSEKAKDLTPDAKLVVLDCGHDVAIDMPAEFNQAVTDFLR